MVKNALKFTEKGSIMILAWYSEPLGSIFVSVKDSGVGIAKEDHNKLFTRFGKLHRTSTMNSEGIGLGLTIVKQIVETSGGTIHVESEGIDRGSCFTFSMKVECLQNTAK